MILKAKTMTGLWHGACRRLLYAQRGELDAMTGLTTLVYDNFLIAKSMEFKFDVGKDLWLTDKRFPKLMRDYLDPPEVMPFLDRCEVIANDAARRGVITQMHCKPARQKDGTAQHVWGNCMLAFTYHGGKRWATPTIGLHSRVSYIAYLGAMDMALAWVLAKEVANRTGIAVEDMQFRWYIDSLQWHGLKSVPYTIGHGHEDAVLDAETYPTREYPAIGTTRRSLLGLRKRLESGDTEHIKYGPARRMNTRFATTQVGGGMPSVPIEKLYAQFAARDWPIKEAT